MTIELIEIMTSPRRMYFSKAFISFLGTQGSSGSRVDHWRLVELHAKHEKQSPEFIVGVAAAGNH